MSMLFINNLYHNIKNIEKTKSSKNASCRKFSLLSRLYLSNS